MIAAFTPSAFGREGFAVTCPLALARSASYAVSVRRPAASALRFFQPRPRGLRLAIRLGFLRPSTPEDLHLLVTPMLGTQAEEAEAIRPGLLFGAASLTGVRPTHGQRLARGPPRSGRTRVPSIWTAVSAFGLSPRLARATGARPLTDEAVIARRDARPVDRIRAHRSRSPRRWPRRELPSKDSARSGRAASCHRAPRT